MKQANEPVGGAQAPSAWAERAIERMLDLGTMAIAILYWQVCQHDERSSREVQPAPASTEPPCYCLDASR